jgi:protein-S-isoprenylcysteine O-methyltransferase Ste14
MFKRLSIFVYGVLSYAVFFATYLYAIGFVGNLGGPTWVPKSMDSPREVPFTTALLTDLALLGLFAIQHSVMARPGFKRWWTRIVPETAERSTYVLLSSLALILMFAYWQPLGGAVSTFLINHFDLFGLRQVWLQLLGKPYTQLKFGTPLFYRYVRHPLYVGWFFAFWATPTMTVTHLVFAIATTAYILIAIQLEERDLVEAHPEYESYRRSVPMLVPFTKRRTRTTQSTVSAVQPR